MEVREWKEKEFEWEKYTDGRNKNGVCCGTASQSQHATSEKRKRPTATFESLFYISPLCLTEGQGAGIPGQSILGLLKISPSQRPTLHRHPIPWIQDGSEVFRRQ